MQILLWVLYICTYRIIILIITTKRLTYQPKAHYTFIERPISNEQFIVVITTMNCMALYGRQFLITCAQTRRLATCPPACTWNTSSTGRRGLQAFQQATDRQQQRRYDDRQTTTMPQRLSLRTHLWNAAVVVD